MNNEKHDHIKWFTIGFLSALAVIALAVTILIYSMTPLVKIDQSNGRVQLLGGFIDVQALDVITQLSKNGSFVVGTIEGIQKIPADTEWIQLKFGSGQMRVDFNATDEINWDCDGAGKNAKFTVSQEEKTVLLDFTAAFVDCDVSVPSQRLKIEGMNGDIEIRKMSTELDVKLVSGDVYLNPIADQKYEFDLKSVTGEVDSRLRSEDSVNKTPEKQPSAVKIRVEVRDGDIQYLD